VSNFKIKKEHVLAFVKGYQSVNKLLLKERRHRLSRLTLEEALKEYSSLCALWDKNREKASIEKLDKERVSFLIARRNRFNILFFKKDRSNS